MNSRKDTAWAIESDWKTQDGKYEFTDGCGRMSTKVAQQFVNKMTHSQKFSRTKKKFQHTKHKVPSVIQFRMMGCKESNLTFWSRRIIPTML